MTVLHDMTKDQLIAMVAAMQAKGERKLSLKVTAKKADGTGTDGAVSLYGLGRFPITLYGGQWERLLGEGEHIKAFLVANAALLSVKS